jgi:hypothetical protein
MPRIRIDLDQETYLVLMENAGDECRPMAMQACVLIRKALGLPVPYPPIIDVTAEDGRPALVGRKP